MRYASFFTSFFEEKKYSLKTLFDTHSVKNFLLKNTESIIFEYALLVEKRNLKRLKILIMNVRSQNN